jgi:ATP-dependent helicase/nuclease subunit A
MTIHASKGLEFPVVFLVNVTRGSGGRRPPVRIAAVSARRRKGGDEPGVSIGDFVSEDDEDVRAREREETKRLLYVAVTRARERLYICATLKDGQLRAPGGSLAEVFPPSFTAVLADAGTGATRPVVEWTAPSGSVHRLRVLALPAVVDAKPARNEPGNHAPESLAAPDRFGRLDLPDRSPRRSATEVAVAPMTPAEDGRALPPGFRGVASDGEAEEPDGGPTRRAIGTLVHRLFRCSLPPQEPHAAIVSRAVTLASGITGAGDGRWVEALPQAAIEEAAATYCSLRSHPDVLDLLGRGRPIYEVPFSARLDDGSIVRGVVDCLVRTVDGSAVVLEFKTGSGASWHERQLQIYVKAIGQAMPGTMVSGRLVYPRQESGDSSAGVARS